MAELLTLSLRDLEWTVVAQTAIRGHNDCETCRRDARKARREEGRKTHHSLSVPALSPPEATHTLVLQKVRQEKTWEREFAYLLLLLLLLGKNHMISGGCLGKCSGGRDMSCTSTDWRMDRVYGTCYCDESCARTKDCCFDYFTHCPARACTVSAWSFWSGCAEVCRPSLRLRIRRVEERPSNNGQPCPSLEERAGCMDYRDHQGRACGLSSGPAFITSMEFGKGRPKHDSFGNPLNPGFCVEFSLESRSPHCTVENRPHTHWMRYFTEGFMVCVACNPPAMSNSSGSCQGDGQETDSKAMLRWQAMDNPRCSGTWRKIRKTQQCNCPPQHSFIFI